MRCVVFGATGYIGGRLVPELLRAGHAVRAVARDPGKLAEAPWRGAAEIVPGDVTDAASVAAAVAGQEVVYYLVHSMHQRDFVEVDRAGARTVAGQA
ncbi:MAG: NAD(P)H-binding protein, partial [Pseudonocardiaceae bacterium]